MAKSVKRASSKPQTKAKPKARSTRGRAPSKAKPTDDIAAPHRSNATRKTKRDRAVDEAPEVGANLKGLRADRDLSLEKLARLTGVSRAMLGQIELGQSTPTIKTLWKIARSLDVPFSALIGGKFSGGATLLRAAETRRMTNEKRTFSSRALFPLGGPRRVEFYELRLAGRSKERAVPHPSGTVENLTVQRGTLEIEVGKERYRLERGDVLVFEADVAHTYQNPSPREAVFYLVMTYAHAAS